MNKVLITGGAGFIGAEIVEQLYNTHEWEITVLDLMSEQIHGKKWAESYLYNRIKGKCRFIKSDIRDYKAVRDAVKDNEHIIHLAAETGTGQSMYMINRYNDVNIMGTSNILQAVSDLGQDSKVKKIILASSRSVYGEGKYRCSQCGVVYPKSRKMENLCKGDFNLYCDKCGEKLEILLTSEECEIKPLSLYAFTKYSQEKLIETMCPVLGVQYTIFRFQNVYGVGQSLKNPYTGILSIFSTLMLENKEINIFEDGLESRDFINVKDVALGVIKSLTCTASNSEVINLGSGEATTVIEIAQILKKIYESNSKLRISGDFRYGDIANNKADISKAQRLLGFCPTVDLETGLNDFCKWVMNSDKDSNGYEKSISEMEKAGMLRRGNGQTTENGK